MLVEFDNIPVSLDAMLPGNGGLLEREVLEACGLRPGEVSGVELLRRSVDARRRSDVHFVVNAAVDLPQASEEGFSRLRPRRGVSFKTYKAPEPLDVPDLSRIADEPDYRRPLVVGAGPAGLFAALYLAQAGLRPLVVERGEPVESRVRTVRTFAEGGPLDANSNIQFGEGGAGTFSDGKLNTGTKSPHIRHVLESFVDAAAPRDILLDARPHIGTDLLPEIVRNLRKRSSEAGAEFRFNTLLSSIRAEGGRLCSASLLDLETGLEQTVKPGFLVLAIGHSARDTFRMLHGAGACMVRKPFAVGVRIEHLSKDVGLSQYGAAAAHPALGAADYRLAVHNSDGRGVYTFCMCPGGTVVAAASEEGGVCVNGMSANARDGVNSNSALLASVNPDDLQGDDVFAGMEMQRRMERAAYDLAFHATGVPFCAPVQTLGDFMSKTPSDACRPSSKVLPTYPRGVAWTDLRGCLPGFVADAIEEAVPSLGRKLRGFDDPEAVLTGVEPRSSSPVRIVRDRETLQSVSIKGLYPTGEGAGYAGGIMSAATDGIRVAERACASLLAKRAMRKAPSVRDALAELAAGRPVIFPTDTIVGIGVSTERPQSLKLLYDAKRRDEGKPVAWLVASNPDLSRYGDDVPAYANALADEFWPGPLTLVVKASDEVPEPFRSSSGTIGLRMPASADALGLLQALGRPIAATSANMAGEPPSTSMVDVPDAFAPGVLRYGGGAEAGQGSGLASTVVDCTSSVPRVLRAGTIPVSEIERIAAR